MKKEQELVLKITKEIVVKFIEVGRLSVNSFEEVWNSVHQSVQNSLGENHSVEDVDQK
jgi:predicted transcriptional regulator